MSRKSKGSRNRSTQKNRFKKYGKYDDFDHNNLERSDYKEIIARTFDQPKTHTKRTVEIKPRSENQAHFLNCLENPDKHIIVACGPAGTGKTMLATQFGIKMLQNEEIDKVVITRPAVSVDEEHGFLPGSLGQKMEPWILPILDVFYEHYTKNDVKKMMTDGTIEIAPLAYMRGRTFKNALIIADEMQNAHPNQVKMVLTRIGENSKIVLTGDLDQHDRGYDDNGLKDLIDRLNCKPSNNIELVMFSKKDIQRHPVIDQVLSLYEMQ